MFKIFVFFASVFIFCNTIKAETLVLEKENTITVRGEVNAQTMQAAVTQLFKMNQKLEKDKPIYLVLDTPGGSIDAGLDFIRYAQSLDREIKTITLTAASMGFVIVQSLGERLILEDGVLMMHRASIGTQGQVPGEVTNRVEHIKNYVENIEKKMAKRMNISLKEYKDKVHDEYYVFGENAVNADAADRVVSVRCGTSLVGTKKQKVQVFIFEFELEFADCPLISIPLEVEPKNKDAAKKNLKEFKKAIDVIKKQYYIKSKKLEVNL